MQQLPPVLYRGSVKNVRGEVSAKNLLFEFSDRYSVFDWGEMPDQLEGKGMALAIMGKSFFQFLGSSLNWKNLFSSSSLKDTFDHDYLKKLESSKTYKKLSLEGLSHHAILNDDTYKNPYLEVQNISVLRPSFNGKTYDYSAYKDKVENALVPLEVIFRLGLSPGNSLSKRCGDDLSKWNSFGFHEIPSFGFLRTPVIDFSTKLERADRYLDYSEAQEISGMNMIEWEELLEMTHLIALNLFHSHHEMELELWDGKVEMAFIPGKTGRSFMLVDSIGIDELRLLYKGKSFSKEFLREVYKESDWHRNLELAKKEALLSGEDFKVICQNSFHSWPEKLDQKIKERAIAVYKTYSNAVTARILGVKYFEEHFNLDDYNQRYL